MRQFDDILNSRRQAGLGLGAAKTFRGPNNRCEHHAGGRNGRLPLQHHHSIVFHKIFLFDVSQGIKNSILRQFFSGWGVVPMPSAANHII
jgi:hypothetical protein